MKNSMKMIDNKNARMSDALGNFKGGGWKELNRIDRNWKTIISVVYRRLMD